MDTTQATQTTQKITRRHFVQMGAAASALVGSAALCGTVARADEAAAQSAQGETPAEGAQGTPLPAGSYETTVQGFNGPIAVTVQLGENAIEDIVITSSRETLAVGARGLEETRRRILAHQSTNVDVVSGATVSSFALQQAVADALTAAGVDAGAFAREAHETYAGPAAEDVQTTVVIAGGGAAGMSTAIRLARQGVPVIIVEKRELMGGTSSRAGYQLMGVGSRTQIESDQVAYKTPDDMYDQYITYDQKGVIDPDMMRRYVDESGDIMDWVRFDIGCPMNRVEPGGMAVMLDAEEAAQGKSWGGYYVERLVAELDRLGVDYRTQTSATDILLDGEGRAVGLHVEAPNGGYDIAATCVVLACGAFGANEEMVAEYLPDWVGYPNNEVPESTGDGILMAQRAGAAMSGLDEDHLVTYTACVKLTETQTIPVSIRAAGGILVNKEGRRFHDELDMQLVNLALAAKEQTEGRYFGIVDQSFIDAMGTIRNTVSADSIEELAEMLGIDPTGLADEVAHYNEMYDAGEDTDFHRLSMAFPIRTAPFWGCELYTGLHGFDGGIDVDDRMQVLKEDGTPFPGLYAEGGGVDFGLATVSAMSGKAFTAKVLADTLIEDLGY